MRPLALVLLFALSPRTTFSEIRSALYQHREVWQMESGELRISITQAGGHIAEIVLKTRNSINPLWVQNRPTIDPTTYVRQRDEQLYGGGSAAKLLSGLMGHNLCFPYWGNPSDSEYQAGMTFHGETGIVPWRKVEENQSSSGLDIQIVADLPESKTRFTRSIRLVSGQTIVYFESHAENLASLDRPIAWCEHVTVGQPFLKKGVTVFDASLTRGRSSDNSTSAELRWPSGQAEVPVDLTRVRTVEQSGFVNNFLVDPSARFGYFAVSNPELRLLFGYVFRREDFSWLNIWEADEPEQKDHPGTLARGMEFSDTPVHGSLRALLAEPRLFDTPTFEWLNAKSRLVKRFCAFSSELPEDFNGVQSLAVSSDSLEIVEKGRGRKVILPFNGKFLQ